MSDGGRERASLGVGVWRSSQKVNAQRSVVRSIAWLDVADSQTKCNTDDVWREGKKKSLEREEERPEGGDEVSATQRGRAERAGGVAIGGTEAGGDRARAWAASQHGVAGAEAQRGPLRWMVSSAARATTGPRAALSVAAQQPIWPRAMGASGRAVAGRVEPRTSLRALALERRAGDQPRDDLPAHLAGSEKWRHAARTSARCAQELPETLRALRQPRATGGKKNDWGAASQCGAAAPDRPLGDRHDDGREPGGEQPLRADPGRAQERLPHAGETPSAHRGRNQPRVAGPDGASSGADAHHHGGQRDRVPLVWPGGSSQSGQVLLRHPASQLGARDQREHQRTHPAVSAQRSNHGPSHPKPMRLNRRTPQQPTKEKTWLQNTQSMLPSDLANVALQS